MANYNEVIDALKKADAAGNVEDARKLAAIASSMKSSPKQPASMGGLKTSFNEQGRREYATRHPYAAKAAKFIQGVPFAGEYLDEALGLIDPANVEKVRALQDSVSRDTPKTAAALQLGGGLVGGGLMAAAAAPAVMAAAPTSLGGQMLAGGAAAGLSGGAEGAISGYGAGTDAESRKREAFMRGGVGAVLGGAMGAAAPLAARGISKAASTIGDHLSVNRLAKESGLTVPAKNVMVRAMTADDSLSGAGAQRLAAMGDDAMLADAGPTARSVLDTTIQRSGAAGRMAKNAVETRAASAGERLRTTLDDVLGVPADLSVTAKDISTSTSAARRAAYDAAYSAPINYADDAGRAIEDVLSRVPSRVMNSAVQKANEAMQFAGMKNQQILASMADDGSVVFKEMPNVQQLDYIKRALGEIGAESVDQFGRKTAEGIRAADLAHSLRQSIEDAAPEYGKAVRLGGDKIAEDRALQAGADLLTRRMTRTDVKEFVRKGTEAEISRAKQGMRSHIEDMMANVSRSVTDGNTDAREAIKAVKEFSSRANREKVADLLGPKESMRLFGELNKATGALELRASVADNSRTYARTAMDEVIKGQQAGSAVEALKRGEPVNAGQRLVQMFTGRSPKEVLAMEDQVYSDIARLLTEKRGSEAQDALRALTEIAQQSPANAEVAKRVGRRLAASGALLADRTGNQLAISR